MMKGNSNIPAANINPPITVLTLFGILQIIELMALARPLSSEVMMLIR